MSQRQGRSRPTGGWAEPKGALPPPYGAFVILFLACACGLMGCQAEKRSVGPTPPASAPAGQADQRQAYYETNAFQAAEGARWFRWYGCGQCHTEQVEGPAKLTDDVWVSGGAIAEIYLATAHGRGPLMPAYEGRATPEQLWQLAAYVHGLHKLKPQVRQRQADAQEGEPSGGAWRGALR